MIINIKPMNELGSISDWGSMESAIAELKAYVDRGKTPLEKGVPNLLGALYPYTHEGPGGVLVGTVTRHRDFHLAMWPVPGVSLEDCVATLTWIRFQWPGCTHITVFRVSREFAKRLWAKFKQLGHEVYIVA